MIGNRLKKIRAERNISQLQLAKLSGVSNVQIAKYEKNKAVPTPQVVQKLASALEVSVDYFFDTSADMSLLFDQRRYEKKLEKLKGISLPKKILFEAFIDKFLSSDEIEKASGYNQ